MNINDQFPSKYMKASDLQGKSFTLTIASIEREEMGGEMKLILYFRGAEKGMGLEQNERLLDFGNLRR